MHVNHLGDILKADSDSVGQGGTHDSVFLTSSSVDALKSGPYLRTSLVGLCWNFSKNCEEDGKLLEGFEQEAV